MTMQISELTQSLAVFEHWQQQALNQRVEIVKRWASLLSQRSTDWAEAVAMINLQCQQATALIGQTQSLPGPTGESNELYCVGRGSFLLSGDEQANSVALLGLISAALVAGNTIICSVHPKADCQLELALSDLLRAGCPDRVAIYTAYETAEALAKQPALAGVALVGARHTCQRFNLLLAEREGQIAQLIYEGDLQDYSLLSEPTLCLRFITERTRTINITAVGGNASLLELGSAE
jgi:delta 1-pyrroline-5-carboxylate dehydrogenase